MTKPMGIVLDHILRHIDPSTGQLKISLKNIERLCGSHAEAMPDALDLAATALDMKVTKKTAAIAARFSYS